MEKTAFKPFFAKNNKIDHVILVTGVRKDKSYMGYVVKEHPDIDDTVHSYWSDFSSKEYHNNDMGAYFEPVKDQDQIKEYMKLLNKEELSIIEKSK